MQTRIFVAFLILLFPSPGALLPKGSTIILNSEAFEFARRLIRDGRFVDDRKGAWAEHKPSHQAENEFRASPEYAKWHLGIDGRHKAGTKAHYKFPFGDFRKVHRCGLLAVKARALEYGYTEIAAAADELLAEIEISHPRR